MEELEKLLSGFVRQTKEILKDSLVGVYLHGSAVMGCFNPRKSDIDMIIVVENSLTHAVKREYMDMVVAACGPGPAKGIEMSIVTADVCDPFVYPTPFELHFSVGHIDWYRKDPDDYVQKMRGTDKDLAGHFMIIKKRGRCLYGAPIDEVFGEVPSADYWDSIWNDIADAEDDIAEDTMYLTLNLARVLAYREEKLVLSKKEGGEWALKNVPVRYSGHIKTALLEYAEGASRVYDADTARRYAGYMIERIRAAR